MPGNQIEIKFRSSLSHAFPLYQLASRHAAPTVVLFHSKDLLEETLTLLQSFNEAHGALDQKSLRIFHWQAWEHSPFSPVSPSISQKIERLRTLSFLTHESGSALILVSIDSLIQPTAPPLAYRNFELSLNLNEDIASRESLRETLAKMGYVKTDLVEEPGQYAIRGEILDLFVPTEPQPYRIEFFDTVIETIRSFSADTQRTVKAPQSLNSIRITPAEEVIFPWDQKHRVLDHIKDYADQVSISRKIRDPVFENVRNGFLPDNYRTWIPFIYERNGYLQDYFPPATQMIALDPEQLQHELSQFLEIQKREEARYEQPYWITPNFESLYGRAAEQTKLFLERAHYLVRTSPDSEASKTFSPIDLVSENKTTEGDVREWLEDGYLVWIGTRGLTHRERLRYLIRNLAHFPGLKLLNFDSGESLQFPLERTVILSETQFFGRSAVGPKKPKRATPTQASKFAEGDVIEFSHLNDLSVGDFVVHQIHGVGKYLGLQELKNRDQALGEYLLIEYSGGDRLFLPVYRLSSIQRYVGAGGNPSVDKLGTAQFEKAKQKARDSARKLAINLVEIYAKRALLEGVKFDGQGEDYFQFCDEFEFTETEGQLKAIQDTLSDLESGRLLDRLVCGDVGFGKTEIAMRAAFQAVQSGYQVALLVPTTLLAFQHEQSFRRRMKNFPIRIESISRFKTKKMQTEILKQTQEGQVDILIGTHRLLSKDVGWNRLGILIVDEEHRFGVEHKEKMKAIQANTHSLTLTATPIPRTLNMAIAGLKEISIIRTPPTNRQSIKTFVSTASEELIKTSIETELARGGQVFFLYNRVQTIEQRAVDLQKLVPHAKIIVAHGQMSEDEIESRMLEFYQGHAQVLVCTTIIESGIDVPNAGTIIIHRADQMGLAQLYQIRGRVGRSHRKAYAYLLVDEERTLTNEAKMRLDVLQRFVELGSGFQIASYDLEIRGGGNFLGAEQSGHIASVGLDLFTELLEEAIQELRGQKIDVEDRHFEPEIKVPYLCEISPEVVNDQKLRLSLYRKLSNAKSNSQIDALYEEFKDRFGELPPETINLFWLIRIKNLLKRVGIELLSVTASRTSITVRKTTLIDPGEVIKISMGPKPFRDVRVSLTPDSKILFQFPLATLEGLLFELETLFRKIAPKAFEIG
jgi:transcription-repair coupling factor (superfamily II helicase)